MSAGEFIIPEEQAYYSKLFRQPWLSNIVEVFQREEELFDLLCHLRRKPRYLSFSLSSGARLQFLSVEKKWTDGGLRLLFSDGTVGGSQPIRFPCARVVDEENLWRRNPSPEEEELLPRFMRTSRHLSEREMLRLPIEQRALPGNEETQTTLKHFACGRPLARATVEQLALPNAPIPDENFALIVRQWQNTDKTSPKELLLLALEEAVNSALSTKLSGERLWQLLYDDRNPMDMPIKELLPASGHQVHESTYRRTEYHEVITRGILNFASEFDDLVTTRLWDHSLLDVALRTAYKKGFLEPRRIGEALAYKVAHRLGFRRVPNGWMKSNERHELRVTGDGSVYINQVKVCMHPVEERSLPRGDVVASLLMTLATDLRRGVLSGPDLEATEALLPLEETATALKGMTKQMEKE